jgi:hypothetical protein
MKYRAVVGSTKGRAGASQAGAKRRSGDARTGAHIGVGDHRRRRSSWGPTSSSSTAAVKCLSGDNLEHIYAKLGIHSRREPMTMGDRLETLIGRKA